MPNLRPSLAERARAELELRRRQSKASVQTPLSFREFVGRANPKYIWFRHCEVLADVLQKVADGTIKRLMVFMPPRHGKSEEVSRLFSAYFLYRFPNRWVGLNSYGADLAYTLSRAARENFTRAGGKVKDDAAAVKHWETEHGGGFWAAGVGGPITGKGWHLGIIDDPLKNAEEAGSATIREKQQEWYGSTFYTREEPDGEGDPDGALIVIQTRWNSEDLSGWLLQQEQGEDDDDPERWHIVSFEAIKEAETQQFPSTCTVEPDWRQPGEALCPERRPVSKLRKIARRIGAYFFAALFQQNPQPAEGNKFKRQWFRYWRQEDDLYRLMDAAGNVVRTVRAKDCRRFGTVDLAVSLKTSADYTVIGAWAVTPDSDLILLDLLRDRMEEPDIIKQARAFFVRHDLAYLAVEANGTQLGIVQTMRRVEGMPIRGIVNSTDKISRASTAIVRCESGQVYFPQGASWLGPYENELLSFPKGAHDDMVDVTSLAANDVFAYGGAPEPDEVREAREATELAEAEARYRDVNSDHWWHDNGGGGW